MSKEVAVDVLNNGIRTLKDLAQPSGKPSQERTYAEMILGIRLLMEALAITLNDSTKSHGSQAFDKAHKQLFGLTQATTNPGYGDYVWIAGGCSALAGALKWLYFDKPTPAPWK